MATRIARENLIVRRGTTFAHVFTWTNGAGTAIDVTGYTATLVIANSAGTTIHTATPTLGGAAGTITATIASTTTDDFTAGSGNSYSLRLTSAGGAITEVYRGHVAIEAVVGL